jgi:putative phosphoesterase
MAHPRNYRIGVIADTHDRWLPKVAKLFAGVDEIWHLGDVCEEPILDHLRAINPKLCVVLGNNDFSITYPLTLDLERCGERFHLVHILPIRKLPACDWLLFGHTHRPVNEPHEGIHLFNPGSAGRGNKGAPVSVGFLVREKGQKFRGEVVEL